MLTQTGVVLVPSPTLSVYTHSTGFDFWCRHWLNSARCPTVVVEYWARGEANIDLNASTGVLVESCESGVADFAGAVPSEGGSPYSFRTLRYDSST